MGLKMLFKVLILSQIFTPSHTIESPDLTHLASIIHAECGVCDDSEQRKTGSVVLNRVDSSRFPNTLHEVIAQPGQFDGYMGEHYYPTKKSRRIAKELLNGFGRVKGILYFWNPKISDDTSFINKMKDRILYKEKFHYYAN